MVIIWIIIINHLANCFETLLLFSWIERPHLWISLMIIIAVIYDDDSHHYDEYKGDNEKWKRREAHPDHHLHILPSLALLHSSTLINTWSGKNYNSERNSDAWGKGSALLMITLKMSLSFCQSRTSAQVEMILLSSRTEASKWDCFRA